MGVVADAGDVDRLAVGENPRGVFGLFRVGRVVFRAAEDQGFDFDVLPVVDHGVHAAHLAGEAADIGQMRPVRAEPVAVADAHVLGEFRLPVDVIPFRPAQQAGVDFIHVRVGVDFTGQRRKAAAHAPIGEADLIDRDQMGRALRVKEGETGHHLPADGMAHHRRPLDAEVIHQARGVGSPQIDAVGDDGFGGFAPAEAVLGDYPVARLAQRGDLPLPVPAVIQPAVVEDHRAAIGGPGGRHIHVGDAGILVVHPEIQITDRIGVLDLFQINRDRPPVRGRRWGRRGLRGYRASREDAREA